MFPNPIEDKDDLLTDSELILLLASELHGNCSAKQDLRFNRTRVSDKESFDLKLLANLNRLFRYKKLLTAEKTLTHSQLESNKLIRLSLVSE